MKVKDTQKTIRVLYLVLIDVILINYMNLLSLMMRFDFRFSHLRMGSRDRKVLFHYDRAADWEPDAGELLCVQYDPGRCVDWHCPVQLPHDPYLPHLFEDKGKGRIPPECHADRRRCRRFHYPAGDQGQQ